MTNTRLSPGVLVTLKKNGLQGDYSFWDGILHTVPVWKLSSAIKFSFFIFKDTNECDPDNPRHRCSQICENTPGSYECFCEEGFELNKDGYQCEGIDLVIV